MLSFHTFDMPTGTELKYNVPHQNENITYHCPFKTLEHYICYRIQKRSHYLWVFENVQKLHVF